MLQHSPALSTPPHRKIRWRIMWRTLFHRYLPDWLALTDKNKLTVYFTGESSLYLRPHLLLWWQPVLAWSGFIVVLLFTTFCINVFA